jgi:hypothetical protein
MPASPPPARPAAPTQSATPASSPFGPLAHRIARIAGSMMIRQIMKAVMQTLLRGR